MFADDFCETMKISDAHVCLLLSSCRKKKHILPLSGIVGWVLFSSPFGGVSDAV